MAERDADTRVLVLDQHPDPYFEGLCEAFPDVSFESCVHGDDAESHARRLQPQIILSSKSRDIPGERKRAAMQVPGVRWVQVCGAGFDHIMPIQDFDATVTNCAGVLSEFLGETMLAMMMSLSLGLPAYLNQQRQRVWRHQPRQSISGKTVLIVGLGNVGRDVARRCKQANMHVLGLRNTPRATEHVDEVAGIDALLDWLPRADYVCLHTPLTAATRDLMGEAHFAAMKPGSYFLNGARGGIVDEQALAGALRSGHLAAAYSDVFATEPLPATDPAWNVPNLVVTPHMADSIGDWPVRYADFFGVNLRRWLRGESLLNVVDGDRGY